MTEFVRVDEGASTGETDSRHVSSRPSSRRNPVNRSQRTLRRPSREAYSTRTVEFDSGGESCSGTLYLPDRPEQPPVVVMAPGLGFWQSFGLPAVAERFAEAGYAAFTFDYRHHGDSDGEPRGLVSPAKQVDDYEAAIDAMRADNAVDSNRLVVWGHSLSGGHALSVAAENFRVAGVIATCPFVDGRAQTLGMLREPKRLLKSLTSGLRDALGYRFGLGSEARIVDEEDGFGVVTAPGAKRAAFDLVDRHADWANRVPARIFLSLPRYRPITEVEEIRCPALVIGGRDDGVVPADGAAAAADGIAEATYLELPVDHFSVFSDDFETVVGHQLTFLRTVVGHR
ncbi:alpha/beta hydrolase [Halohasta salina]|uniref:alpha/beta hydrolase n=1 Tax=Halohasta salina TaxID=2961621 RepID=UPI0020A5214F|nr:alpha/beta fold hydrolase [Halohasta salina]